MFIFYNLKILDDSDLIRIATEAEERLKEVTESKNDLGVKLQKISKRCEVLERKRLKNLQFCSFGDRF